MTSANSSSDSSLQTEVSSHDLDWAPPQRMQPRVALKALRRLIDDPERTNEVFNVIRALSGSSLSKGLQRFSRIPLGGRVLADRRELLNTLLDRDALALHGKGSLADRYLAFTREGNITADGLVEASEGRERYESADA